MEISDHINEWNLIKEGRYQEAYQLFSNILKLEPERASYILAARGLCLLLLNRFEEAFTDYNSIIQIKPNNASGYLGAGIALMLVDNYLDGIQFFQESYHARYTDAAGGILAPAFIYYAAIKLQDKKFETIAIKRLRKLWTPRVHRIWPGAIAGFLLNEIDESVLLDLASNKNQTLEMRRFTQSYFWLAMRHSSDNRSLFVRYLQLSRKGHILEFERLLADKEISSLVT
jgi:tetratricopeptide (TPR) repeat protein